VGSHLKGALRSDVADTQKELNRNDRYTLLGMVFAFRVFLILIGCALYMRVIGNYNAVWVFTTATMVGIVSSFLSARR